MFFLPVADLTGYSYCDVSHATGDPEAFYRETDVLFQGQDDGPRAIDNGKQGDFLETATGLPGDGNGTSWRQQRDFLETATGLPGDGNGTSWRQQRDFLETATGSRTLPTGEHSFQSKPPPRFCHPAHAAVGDFVGFSFNTSF
ncbi:hypothetical protein ACOMHN_063182 [Nucella lapillus]